MVSLPLPVSLSFARHDAAELAEALMRLASRRAAGWSRSSRRGSGSAACVRRVSASSQRRGMGSRSGRPDSIRVECGAWAGCGDGTFHASAASLCTRNDIWCSSQQWNSSRLLLERPRVEAKLEANTGRVEFYGSEAAFVFLRTVVTVRAFVRRPTQRAG